MNPKDWAELIGNLGIAPVIALIVLLRIEPSIRRLEKAILLFVAANGSTPKLKNRALKTLGIDLADILEDGEE